MKITIDDLRKRIAHDPRQSGEPFQSLKTTLAHVEADPRLVICYYCEGKRGYVNIIGHYTGCKVCGGRGVLRKHWWMLHVKLPPSFYEEPLPSHAVC